MTKIAAGKKRDATPHRSGEGQQDAPLSATEIAQGLRRNYRLFQYQAAQFLTDHLADCSRAFNGDLQQMLVLALLGQVALDARARGLLENNAQADCISASRLADVSGIPRETVRRKLGALHKKGWIEQVDNGSWRLKVDAMEQAHARGSLNELDQRSVMRWATLFAAIKPLI